MRTKIIRGLTGLICVAFLLNACGKPYQPAVLLEGSAKLEHVGMQLSKIEGLSGDADSYIFDETEDALFTGKAAICYNLTRDRVVYSIESDYGFATDRFSPFTILRSVLEYETGEDYVSMMEETYLQELKLNDLFRTVKELSNYKEFLDFYGDTFYRSANSRIQPIAQYDCWDENNGCMRFLYVKKDGVQEYILLLIGVATDEELDRQTDHILANLIK